MVSLLASVHRECPMGGICTNCHQDSRLGATPQSPKLCCHAMDPCRIDWRVWIWCSIEHGRIGAEFARYHSCQSIQMAGKDCRWGFEIAGMLGPQGCGQSCAGQVCPVDGYLLGFFRNGDFVQYAHCGDSELDES